MANLRYPGFIPPAPNAPTRERVLWRLFNSPQAVASGLAMPMGNVPQRVAEANPGLIKWVMDRAGNVIFGHAGQYHDEMLSSGRWAGGVIDNGRVNVYRDLVRAGEGALNSIRQAVAQAWTERGRELSVAAPFAALLERLRRGRE